MLEGSSSYAFNRDSANFDPLTAPAPVSREAVSLILIEPELAFLPDRVPMLTEADYRVTTVRDIRELFPLCSRSTFTVALLSELLGPAALDSAARFVRSQWPVARILLLGSAQRRLEDHLYDERIDASCTPQDLLKMLATFDQRKLGGRPFIVPSLDN
jgi:hypothetical protein